MVSVSINFANNKEVMKRIDSLGKYLRKAMREALVPSAQAVKKEAIPRVRSRTGKTRSTIDYSADKGISAHVGSNWMVSRFLENGTVRMRAYPALRPALESCRQEIQQFFFIEIDRAITKASAGA